MFLVINLPHSNISIKFLRRFSSLEFWVNINFNHKKLIHIPIGLQNRHWNKCYPEIITYLLNNHYYKNKNYLLYGNFKIDTNVKIRKPIAKFFKIKKF